MTIRRKKVLPLALAFGAVGMLYGASSALATHPHPKGATPLASSLVVAFQPCTTPTPGEFHGTPLSSPSCTPPVQTSSFLTVGSPDANGAPANSTGKLRLDVTGTPDVKVASTITDVRCLSNATGGCAAGPSNLNGQNDYTGTLQDTEVLRITDHNNGTPGPGGTDAATVQDISFNIESLVQPGSVPGCTSTASTTIGSSCQTTTTINTVAAGAVIAGQKANIEIGQVQINDGGPDGSGASTTGNTLFEVQGIFIP
jgi:hypothetical protein